MNNKRLRFLGSFQLLKNVKVSFFSLIIISLVSSLILLGLEKVLGSQQRDFNQKIISFSFFIIPVFYSSLFSLIIGGIDINWIVNNRYKRLYRLFLKESCSILNRVVAIPSLFVFFLDSVLISFYPQKYLFIIVGFLIAEIIICICLFKCLMDEKTKLDNINNQISED